MSAVTDKLPSAPETAPSQLQCGMVSLSAIGIHKAFGTTHALRSANLHMAGGELHALLGENGAGKSTLLKVLVGGVSPDVGELRMNGQLLALRDVRDAIGRGILPIYQQLSLVPHLSVAENLLAFELARGRGWSRARVREQRERARGALASVGLDVDPRVPVAELSLAQRQLVEIARSVMRDCRVLLLDEPTTSLTAEEVDVLFDVVGRMRASGTAVLFISHRLDEVERVADRVTVMRDGQTVVAGREARAVSRSELVEAMVGREVVHASGRRPTRAGRDGLSVAGLCGRGAFRDVSLSVGRGEIVGLVGLIGSGATEVGEGIAGVRPVRGGTVSIGGRSLGRSDRAAALRSGIGFIPIDRDRDGLFPGHSILHNASVSSLRGFVRGGLLSVRRERAALTPRLASLRVKPDDPDASISAASGGNRQKVLVVRNLSSECSVLVAQEPTRGVDIAARQEIHQAFLDAAAGGLAILVTSSDLDEVGALCDRVLVMRAGHVVAEVPPDDIPRIVRELTGVS